MADIILEHNQIASVKDGQTEEINNRASKNKSNSTNSLSSASNGVYPSNDNIENEAISDESLESELSELSFEELEERIRFYTTEKNLAKLRQVENFINKCQKLVQDRYKELLSHVEGKLVEPDGKISFEEISKTVAGRRYTYTRMYWKENGVKKGKVIQNQMLKKMKNN